MSVTMSDEVLKDGLHRITLAGTLDAPNTMTIEDDFRTRVMGLGGQQVIVDLSDVDYMSSYGLRMFLIGAKLLDNRGGTLHLAGPNPKVMEVIRLAGYDTMFPVHETVDEAILLLAG